MEWWEIALVIAVVMVLALIAGAFITWRVVSGRTRRLAGRIGALPWGTKLELAQRLFRDERHPIAVRIVLPLLVLYLALPLDLVPDFVPVIGQIDDILAIVIGMAILGRFGAMGVLDEHLSEIEPAIEAAEYKRLPAPK
jgi:uncharacterized membrane protein YkvA (DUF1232 family)